MIKKYWKIWLLIIIIVVAGIFYYKSNSKNTQSTQQTIAPNMVMEVTEGSLMKTVDADGFIEPIDEEDLAFPSKSAGSVKVKKIYVNEGDHVEKGQLLIELDETEARLNYLQKQNAYNRSKINGSKNEIEEARLNLNLAENQLENLDLKAPFSGIITDIYLEEGNYYTSGAALTIKDISRLQIEVNIDESEIPTVKLGQKVLITLSSLPGVKLAGEVSELGNEANNSNSVVTLPIKVLLEKTDHPIKLGVSATLQIIIDQISNNIIIPITAIINDKGKDFVMKIVDDKPVRTPVKTGLTNGLKIAVESGLQTGDKILINSYRQAPGFNPNSGRPGAFMGGRR